MIDGNQVSQRIAQIFEQAWEASGDVRIQLLDELCAGDLQLRSEVEKLLAAAEQTEQSPAWNQPAILLEAGSIARQEQAAELDRYKLLEPIGSGGMGVVYKAVRADDTFSKFVAVKIVQSGVADERVLRRFVQERQILAAMEHPNIARLLDGGVTAQGLPFLVMEYVDGVPIDKFVASKNLPVDARLQLFQKICAAVSYAHRNLIVHRDLKPGNILVTAEGDPKLLDFGIAKLLSDPAPMTRTEHSSMTPEYASPEQIEGGHITTSSDIYTLGVLLYEMLAGHRPYRHATGAMEIFRAIVEESPERLGGGFDQDLDNIVQMALRKEPARRYASVDLMAEDIRRYRDGYPITARPDTRGYRVKKFVGRNRGAVTAVVIVLLALLLGSFAIWREAQIAERRFNDVRRLANSYLFEFHDSIKDVPGTVAAQKLVLKRGLEFLDKLAAERGSDVELGRELGSAYEKLSVVQGGVNSPGLGDLRGGLATLRKALAIRRELAAAAPSNLDIARELAFNHAMVGWYEAYLGDPSSGAEDLRKAVELGEKVLAAQPADPKTRRALATSYVSLADVMGNSNYENLGDAKGALPFYRKGLDLREKLVAEFPENSGYQVELAASFSRLGQLLQGLNDQTGAVAALRRAAELSDAQNLKSPGSAQFRRDAAASSRNLAMSLMKAGLLDEARQRSDRATALFEQIANSDPANMQARLDLAAAYYAQGQVAMNFKDYPAARKYYESSIARYQAVAKERPADPPHPGLRSAYRLLAELNLATGDSAAAIASVNHELAINEVLLKADPKNAGANNYQGLIFRQMGQAYLLAGRQSGAGSLREAKRWFERSAAVFQEQKDKGTLLPVMNLEWERARTGITQCDAALGAH